MDGTVPGSRPTLTAVSVRSITPRRLSILLGAVPAVLLLVAGWVQRWMADDAFVYVRVVDNVLGGAGPVFNEGERVEAYTSPLWLGILSVGSGALRFADTEWIAVVVGIVASVGGLVAAMRGAQLLWAAMGRTGAALPLGALTIACLPPYWDFASSGLETGLALGWLGLAFWALAALHARLERGEPAGRWPALAAATVGLGPLVRPDLAVFSAAFIVALLLVVRPASRWRAARLVALAAALPIAYQVCRMGYFAALVPNPAYAKEAGEAQWSRGQTYLLDFFDTYALWIPLAGLLAYLAFELLRTRPSRPALAIALSAVAGGLVHILYVVRVGGDFMHARLLLPSAFGLLLPVAVVVPRRALAFALAAVIVPWAVMSAVVLRTPYGGRDVGIANERSAYASFAGFRNPVTLDDYAGTEWATDGDDFERLAERERGVVVDRPGHPPPPPLSPIRHSVPARVVAFYGSVGIVANAAGRDVHIVDWFGLGDSIAARLRLEGERTGRTGHEKRLPFEWVLARYVDPAAPVPTPGVAAARRALGCGDLARLVAATEAPMRPRRFMANLKLAVELRDLRVPAEPGVAERELC